jgi:hypothetical protein
MAEKEGSTVKADKHTVIIIVLAVLFLGSLTFSIFVLTGEGKKSEERVGGTLPEELLAGKEDDALLKLKVEKQQLEEEKAALEKEKLKLQEKKSEVEKQLIEELESRPVFNVDKDSPFDHVKDSQVRVLQNKVEIDLKGVTWWTIEDTNSMDPVLDIGSTALSVKPYSEESLHDGDVALYDSHIAKTVIIHRIIKTNTDAQGWYSTFKGDNLEKVDPENVRFQQIKGVIIGIIY